MGVGGVIAGLLGLGVVLAVAQKFLGVNPLSALGQGIGQFGAGVQTAISDIFSPQITPSFVPTIGLKLGFGLTTDVKTSTSTSTTAATTNIPKYKSQGFQILQGSLPPSDGGQMLINWRGWGARETGAWDRVG